MEDMCAEEIEGLERSFEAVMAKRRAAQKTAQFSIADPPNRDRATSQPAKAKDAAAATAPALAGEIRRRLKRLLKKN